MDANKIRALIDRWLSARHGPDRPPDPMNYVREPKRWSPDGRSGWASVEEPAEPVLTEAFGAHRPASSR